MTDEKYVQELTRLEDNILQNILNRLNNDDEWVISKETILKNTELNLLISVKNLFPHFYEFIICRCEYPDIENYIIIDETHFEILKTKIERIINNILAKKDIYNKKEILDILEK